MWGAARRVALSALTAILLAEPALAQSLRLGVIKTEAHYGGNTVNEDRAFAAFQGMLREHGVLYDVLPQIAVPTSAMMTGDVKLGSSQTQHYGAFWEWNYRADHGANTFYVGHNPDSLTLTAVSATQAFWKAGGVPIVYSGNSGNVGGNNWATTASCSTGAGGCTAPFSEPSTMAYAAYLVNGPEVWKTSTTNYVAVKRLASTPAGTFTRTLVAYNVVPGTYPGFFATCSACNDVARKDQANADTMVSWVRYRLQADGTPELANGRYFVMGHVSNATALPMDLWVMTLASVDSALSHRLIGQTPNYSAPRIAFHLTRAYTTGSYLFDIGGQHLGRGMFIPSIDSRNAGTPSADSSDQNNVIAGVDSLATLRWYTPAGMMAVPWTVGVSTDSIAVFPSITAALKRLPSAEFYPESWSFTSGAGKFSQPTDGRAAPVGPSAADIFGRNRTRTWFPLGGSLPCSAVDTCIACQIIAAQAKLTAAGFPLSHAICPPEYDHIPSNYSGNRNGIPGPDTVGGALLLAGIDHIIVAPEAAGSQNGASFAVNGVFTPQPTTTDYAAFQTRDGSWPVRTATSNTWLTLCATRGVFDDPIGVNNNNPLVSLYGATHPNWNEFICGHWFPMWYSLNIPYYYHNFYTKFSVVSIRLAELGGTGEGRPATRPGYSEAVWLVGTMSAINRLNGGVVENIVPVDQL
jgi:hypothetical protein